MFYYAQQLQRSAQMNAVLTRVCWIIKCAFQQEPLSLTSSLGCASYPRPGCCKRWVTLVETPCSKGAHSPWALLEETTTGQDTNHAAAFPAPPLDVRKPQALASKLNCHTLTTPYNPETGWKPLLPGVGSALQQIHGVEGSQQQCFKEPKLDALDDLHCSPALAWQLYFWLNCIFWFANVGSGNTSGETWPQLRMRSFATYFPWGQHFAHFF